MNLLSDLDKIADSQLEEITKVIVEIKGELDIVEKSFNLLPHNESMPSSVQKKHSDECTKFDHSKECIEKNETQYDPANRECICEDFEVSENGFPCKEILN